jgi:hypothetical protein
MRLLLPTSLVLLSLAACSGSGTKNRLARIRSAKEATAVGGPRQAQDFALAVDDAYQAGDCAKKPKVCLADANDAIAAIDRALPTARVDAPTLVAWRARMLFDSGRRDEAYGEYERSFSMGPNEVAGVALIEANGKANRPDLVGAYCAKTVPVLRTDDTKLWLIERCRKRMNAISPEGEMSWMSPELVAWYKDETARRERDERAAANARTQREKQEQSVVRGMEQCAASCKERGLYCQNECHHDEACEDRCVEINHACLDRCESKAYDRLGQ